jgi:hypothetical protein
VKVDMIESKEVIAGTRAGTGGKGELKMKVSLAMLMKTNIGESDFLTFATMLM